MTLYADCKCRMAQASDCGWCKGTGFHPVNIDWEGAAGEYASLSSLDFDPDRAVKAILAVALGADHA